MIHTPRPSVSIFSKTTRATNGTSTSLEYSVQVTRLIHISSILQTSNGLVEATWTQNLAYSNHGTLQNKGNDQHVRQNTSGLHASSSPGYRRDFSYPLWVASTYDATPGGLTIEATMGRGKHVGQIGELAFHNDWKAVAPDAAFRGSKITNAQNGTASYINIPAEGRAYGYGSTEQHYLLSGILNVGDTALEHDQVLYQRDLVAVNGTIPFDRQVLHGNEVGTTDHDLTPTTSHGKGVDEFAMEDVRALLNRGPQ